MHGIYSKKNQGRYIFLRQVGSVMKLGKERWWWGKEKRRVDEIWWSGAWVQTRLVYSGRGVIAPVNSASLLSFSRGGGGVSKKRRVPKLNACFLVAAEGI